MGAGLVAAVVAVPATTVAAGAAPPAAAPVTITGGSTTLVLSSQASAAVAASGFALSLASPAAPGNGGVAFPITTGSVDANTLAGSISHSGGLTFSKQRRVLTVRNFTIDTRTSTLTAGVDQLFGLRVPLATLDLSKATVTKSATTVTVAGVPATLTLVGAAALDLFSFSTAFAPGTPLGTATVRATIG